MLYLSGSFPVDPICRQQLLDAGVGFMATPAPHRGWDAPVIALDNGCFSSTWEEMKWKQWLQAQSVDALFAVVPDVVGDAEATLAKWSDYYKFVKSLGFKAAFVIQDGQDVDSCPWDELDAIFIGGTTEYKLSHTARDITFEAKRRGKWVHMGRVNSYKRIKLADSWGVDSVDGTFIRFAPTQNTPRLVGWLHKLRKEKNEQQLF